MLMFTYMLTCMRVCCGHVGVPQLRGNHPLRARVHHDHKAVGTEARAGLRLIDRGEACASDLRVRVRARAILRVRVSMDGGESSTLDAQSLISIKQTNRANQAIQTNQASDLLQLDCRLARVTVRPREQERSDAAAVFAIASISFGSIATTYRTTRRLADNDARALEVRSRLCHAHVHAYVHVSACAWYTHAHDARALHVCSGL